MSKQAKDFFDEMREQEAELNKHPVKAFFVHTYDFFRYRLPQIFTDARYAIKHGFQRMFRGYDDRYRWSYYSENTEVTLQVLKWMRENKHGSPYTNDPKKYLKTPDTVTEFGVRNDDWHKRWSEALDLMIEGFEALRELDDLFIEDKNGKYDKKATDKARKVLEKKWKIGSTLFINNYRGLWD